MGTEGARTGQGPTTTRGPKVTVGRGKRRRYRNGRWGPRLSSRRVSKTESRFDRPIEVNGSRFLIQVLFPGERTRGSTKLSHQSLMSDRRTPLGSVLISHDYSGYPREGTVLPTQREPFTYPSKGSWTSTTLNQSRDYCVRDGFHTGTRNPLPCLSHYHTPPQVDRNEFRLEVDVDKTWDRDLLLSSTHNYLPVSVGGREDPSDKHPLNTRTNSVSHQRGAGCPVLGVGVSGVIFTPSGMTHFTVSHPLTAIRR